MRRSTPFVHFASMSYSASHVSPLLVGRDDLLALAERRISEVAAGRGHMLLLAGEPGIGKSRLADELSAHAIGRGAQVLVGRCWEAGGAPAYWPWVQLLRAYVREAQHDTLRAHVGAGAADLAQIVPELRETFSDLPAPRSLEPDAARFRLFDATAELLRKASRSQPLVLVLDDLHAADEPSLLLLRFLARGQIDLSPVITASFPLAQATEALEAAQRSGENIKVQMVSE